ncbi:MAG: GNAT family N-acetyltransferase [Candidatus Eremiobacteraeota bacterium]|nr:GNAT family N-acetyltransferase [Candidatus Eremiobacteraeota bacterium]
MRQLLDVFATAFGEPENYRERQPSDAYLRAFLERSDAVALAAVVEEAVVGGLVAYVLTKFEQERFEVYIYDLAVAAEFRRRGIATALIEDLRRIAREIGAYVIYVQADRGDDAATALYESLGKCAEVLHFDIGV